VRRYSKNKPELEGLVTGVAGVSIRSVAADPRGKRVAVTSEYVFSSFELLRILIYDISELTVRVIDLEDTLKIKILKGHSRSVRKVTWHPSGSLLVCDLIRKPGCCMYQLL
jgi:chromosome transmission fidelity protein 4